MLEARSVGQGAEPGAGASLPSRCRLGGRPRQALRLVPRGQGGPSLRGDPGNGRAKSSNGEGKRPPLGRQRTGWAGPLPLRL